MLMIANREVGQRIERKKGFADFMILFDISPELMWQEPTLHMLVELHMISPA